MTFPSHECSCSCVRTSSLVVDRLCSGALFTETFRCVWRHWNHNLVIPRMFLGHTPSHARLKTTNATHVIRLFFFLICSCVTPPGKREGPRSFRPRAAVLERQVRLHRQRRLQRGEAVSEAAKGGDFTESEHRRQMHLL